MVQRHATQPVHGVFFVTIVGLADVQERDGKGRCFGKMISVERMTDNEASVPENFQGEWIRLMKLQALLLLEWTAFYPSGDSKPTGLDRFYLQLIVDFWGRILLR